MSPAGADAVRQHWRAVAERGLPGKKHVVERNAAITARYARWYRDHRDLLKWAGVAALTSYQVGVVLSPYDITAKEDRIEDLFIDGRRPDDLDTVIADIDLLRQTNNLVFDDIAWTHAAYVAEGLDPVERGLENVGAYERLRQGFRHLDQARATLERATDDAARRGAGEMVWSGSALLLEHEQLVTVQPQFDQFLPRFAKFLSVATTFSFDADHFRAEDRVTTSFYRFMATRGLWHLARKRSLPDIRDIEQRWFWIENRILPMWREVDGKDLDFGNRLDRLIARQEEKARRSTSRLAINVNVET